MTDARVYLESFREQEARIQIKIKRMQELRDRLVSISVPLDKENVSHTKNQSVMADTIALIIDMQKEIDQQTSQLIKAEQETYRLFDRIHPESASILMEHFIRGKKTIDMGKSLCLSQRQIRRKLCEAIAELQKVFNEEEKGSLN